jgi:hypothetical protein
MHRLRLPFLAGLFALACTGCLDFDKESAVAVFRPEKDEVRVLFVYEGLHVAGKGESDLDTARKALTAIFGEAKGFYFGHPLFAVGWAPPEEGKNDSGQNRREFLKKHLDIQKTIFFVGKDNYLGAAQTLVVHNATKFVDGVNAMVSDSVSEQLKKPPKEYDEATIALLKKAVAEKHAWFQLEPGRVRFTFPGSPQYLAMTKRKFLEDLGVKNLRDLVNPPTPEKANGTTIVNNRKDNRDKLPLKGQIEATLKDFDTLETFFTETPLSVDQRRDRITLAIGVGVGEPLRVTSPYRSNEPGNKSAALQAHARTLSVPFQEGATPDGLIAAFLKQHGTK